MLIPNESKVNRLGIFFFYDSAGVVDDYVLTLLDGFKSHFSDLAIVCNGKLNKAGHERLQRYTDKLIVRPNKGFDVMAYKTALDTYGWKKLVEFDEVVLFNATIMGPVYPFSEMFEAMDKRDLDFWGITKFHYIDKDPFGRSEWDYLPEHIQSHFMAYRRSFVESKDFQNYWDNLPPINNYLDAVGLHEAPFTKRFADKGFKWDVYVNTDDLEGFTYGPITFAAKQLIEEKRCPIFKRRSFFDDYGNVLNQSVGNAAYDLYRYLRDHTDFDTRLIWQNATRSMDLSDVVKNMQMNFILPDHAAADFNKNQKIALILHIYYLDLLPKTLKYVRSMPAGSDVIITVGSQEKVEAVREATKDMTDYHFDIRLIENRGRDVSALLAGVGSDALKYDLICFAHDKKVLQLYPYSVGDGFAYKCFENILSTPEFVSNVIKTFDRNPHIGVMMPNPPNHGDYFHGYAWGWGPNYEGTVKFLKKLGINVPHNPYTDCIAPMGTMFWFRPTALKGLIDKKWRYEDFPPEPNKTDGTLLHFIERSYCYVAQSNGFTSAYLFSQSFASIELTNLAYETRRLTQVTSIPWGRGTLHDTIDTISRNKGIRSAIKYRIIALLKGNKALYKGARSVLHSYHKMRHTPN